MAITLTDAAVRKLVETRNAQSLPDTTFARLGVKGGGCAGYSYQLDFDAEEKPGDNTFEFTTDAGEHIVVRVDPKSYLLLNGLTVDFINTLMEQRFSFENPQASGQCGCGTSFAV